MRTLDAAVERLATFLGQLSHFAVLLLWDFGRMVLGAILFALIYVGIPMYVVRRYHGPVRFLPFMVGFGLFNAALVTASICGAKLHGWWKQDRTPGA